MKARDYIDFTGRIGSGLCRHRCTICGQDAKWPGERIVHAETCLVTLLEEIEALDEPGVNVRCGR